MDIKAWVKAARAYAKLSQEELGHAVGRTKANIGHWETGNHEPSLNQLDQISKITGYPVPEFGSPKLAAANDLDAPAFSRGTRENDPPPYSTMTPILAWEHEAELPAGEYVMVPRLDIRLSAGNGQEQIELEFVKAQPQAFRTEWIRSKRLRPAKLASMTAKGDSMEDRIHDGDALVIDTSQTDVIDGKPYALWYEGGERVKRLFRIPGGGLRICSDNRKYPDIVLAAGDLEHVRIIGRVVHISGDGGL